MNNTGHFIHPEVKKEVLEEYARLSLKFPKAPAKTKMHLAKRYVNALLSAYTASIMVDINA